MKAFLSFFLVINFNLTIFFKVYSFGRLWKQKSALPLNRKCLPHFSSNLTPIFRHFQLFMIAIAWAHSFGSPSRQITPGFPGRQKPPSDLSRLSSTSFRLLTLSYMWCESNHTRYDSTGVSLEFWALKVGP